MKRRTFAKLAAIAGISASLPISTRGVHAATDSYGGPYYILVNAGGGWDPRFMFDPHLDPEQNRLYTEIGKVGNISFAPIPLAPTDPELENDPNSILISNEEFLNRHGNRLCVLNGVDMKTNNHDAGSRAIWSGKLQEGYPSLGALVAAAHAPDQPMTYLSSGGYDAAENLVPLTRVGSSSTLQRIAYPNRVDPTNAENVSTFHSPKTWSRIKRAQAEKLASEIEAASLPRLRQSMAQLALARANDADLQKLELPDDLVDLGAYNLRAVERPMQQAQIAIKAFQSGIASAVNLSIGGFDTHGNHDRDQPASIATLLTLVDFIVSEVEAAGLTKKVVVLVGSDFARGPYYNGPDTNDGKDHWSIGSFLAMGPGIEGDRVIGGTTDSQRAIGIDPKNLALKKEEGTVLTPQLIHHSLRSLAAVDSIAQQFPLSGTPLPLFG